MSGINDRRNKVAASAKYNPRCIGEPHGLINKRSKFGGYITKSETDKINFGSAGNRKVKVSLPILRLPPLEGDE